MVVIDELEQEQLRCLYGEKAIWEYRYKKTQLHAELRNVNQKRDT